MLLSIQETKIDAPHYEATLSVDNRPLYHIVVNNPFSEKDEALLGWYFEQYLQHPFMEQVKSQQAAQSVVAYGETLFNAVFENRKAWANYQNAVQAGKLEIEIVGSPAFQALHWEALKDPEMAEPLALHYPIVRKVWGESQPLQVGQASPTLNVLLVVARPHGKMDVGFRTISLPLVQAVQQAKLPVKIEILRPATLPALRSHLEETTARYGKGYYHLVHFDVHGSLLTHQDWQQGIQLGRYTYDAQGTAFAGHKACLFLAGEKVGQAQPVEANRLGELLTYHGIPLVILNACQSAKQQHSDTETSLGSRLSQTGAQAVVAMAYSVTVSAATLFMATLYQQLFAQQPLAVALRLARAELYHQKQRQAYYNQQIALEDWLLPVVYQQAAVKLPLRKFTKKEEKAYYEQQGQQYEPPPTNYAFVGRDVEVLEIENRLLTQGRILLIQGMAGMGKTTLLHHLGRWWQATHFVQRVFYFGYDQKLYTQQEVLHELARQLLSSDQFKRFLAWQQPAQQAKVEEELNKNRHLLILDNLEILAAPESDGVQPVPAEEREALHGWLRKLAGGKSVVVLGSRSEESWLALGTFADNVYPLGGLDAEAASQLVDKILQRHHVSHYREDAQQRESLQRLVKILAGQPLALQIILANLEKQTPAAVLAALEAGDVRIDFGSQKKTKSLVACIDYSYRRLSGEAQKLLLCLAPFTGVIHENGLKHYTEKLQQQPALAELPFAQWEMVLQEAKSWGLLTTHPDVPQFLQIHPILPYFLRHRWQALPEYSVAIETAFRQHYNKVGGAIRELLNAKQPEEKILGQVVARLEQENLWKALTLSVVARESFVNPYQALSHYLELFLQDYSRALQLGEWVLQNYLTTEMREQQKDDYLLVLDDLARQHFNLKHYSQAQDYYQQALGIDIEFNDRYSQAGTYHQLGNVAYAQRQWPQAQDYYQQALGIKIEFKDRYSQASTYHQLGIVAQEQRQWRKARKYYCKALRIKIKFNDRYSQASTYHQLGRVTQEQRQWPQAQDYYQKALGIKIEFNDRYSQASTYHQLGRVAQEQRQWPQAQDYYQQALGIYIEFNDRYSQARTYHQLGIVAQEQRQWPQAQDYYQKALGIYIEFNDRYEQAGTYHQLGRVAEEQEQWQEAKEYFFKALPLYNEFADTYSIETFSLPAFARLYQQTQDESVLVGVSEVLGVSEEEVRGRFGQGSAASQT